MDSRHQLRAVVIGLAMLLAAPSGSSGAASRAGAPLLRVRVSFKRVQSDADASTTWSNEVVRRMVRVADRILRRRARMSLEVVDVVNVRDPGTPASWWDAIEPSWYAFEQFAKQPSSGLHWRTDAVNVFLANELYARPLGWLAGLCSLPSQEIVLLANYGRTDDSMGHTLAHELGHYFNLRHTFDGSDELRLCSEISPECDQSGDLVCDTPPDPNDLARLDHIYRNACNPPDQHAYRTLRYNVMSYYPDGDVAQAILTPGQVERMRAAATKYRSSVVGDERRPTIPSGLLSAHADPACLGRCRVWCQEGGLAELCRSTRAECYGDCDPDATACRTGCDQAFVACAEPCVDRCRRRCDQAPVPENRDRLPSR